MIKIRKGWFTGKWRVRVPGITQVIYFDRWESAMDFASQLARGRLVITSVSD